MTDDKQKQFKAIVAKMSSYKRLNFIRKFSMASSNAYNALCDRCKQIAQNPKLYCEDCNKKTREIMRPVYKMLKETMDRDKEKS